ncbi:dTDP-4-dehydrorhamnose reductase [Brevundimonas sp. LM2]|uniref:dTDP-4-dehydrorhamnose reductase n=1 Tax=Brevundimonas sp. LM2 TaxID=1938605 RepID=UPI0009839473|nr:dTDP-4-dehydrorhamnose reductase [Brevundimonas sp. LM2]AQR63341.1 dTDP-4-dehydrorhamnose reductase [Brevundimonas sp. LM2]
MVEPVHILVTGGTGQVGLELTQADWPPGVVIHAPDRDALNLGDRTALKNAFSAMSFAAVINAGAYTAVDKAETDMSAAFAANGLGPAVLAEITRSAGIPLIHVSTDYVFNGLKADPYVEDDPVDPLSIYGASKLAGEMAVRLGNPKSVILRTAWVLSIHRTNFLKTMLRLACDRPMVKVVADQVGCPTSARDIATTLKTITLRMIHDPKGPTGTYHFVNAGEASWAGLAEEIFRVSGASGGPSATVETISTAEYPTPARRPANSRLLTSKLKRDFDVGPRPWQLAVVEIIAELDSQRARK